MKRNLSIVIFLSLFFFLTINSHAAGSCTQYPAESLLSSDGFLNQKILTFHCVADSAAATFPATPISTENTALLKGWYLYYVETELGLVKPTNLWDFTLKGGAGIDKMGGNGTDMSGTVNQERMPLISTGVGFAKPLSDAWMLEITNNLVNSAVIVFRFVFVR